jgi:type VI protein secretion system component VasK
MHKLKVYQSQISFRQIMLILVESHKKTRIKSKAIQHQLQKLKLFLRLKLVLSFLSKSKFNKLKSNSKLWKPQWIRKRAQQQPIRVRIWLQLHRYPLKRSIKPMSNKQLISKQLQQMIKRHKL